MNNASGAQAWYSTIVASWRRQVFSANLLHLLLVIETKIDFSSDTQKAAQRSLAMLDGMRDDADLRHWLHEQAAIPEAIAVVNAVELVRGKVVHPTAGTSPAEFEQLVISMQAKPMLLTVARIGLQMLLALPPGVL